MTSEISALILLTNFVAATTITMDAIVTTKAASSPSGRSALTNQLHDCLFYLGSVMRLRMCRTEKNKKKLAKVHTVSLLLVSTGNFIVTLVL